MGIYIALTLEVHQVKLVWWCVRGIGPIIAIRPIILYYSCNLGVIRTSQLKQYVVDTARKILQRRTRSSSGRGKILSNVCQKFYNDIYCITCSYQSIRNFSDFGRETFSNFFSLQFAISYTDSWTVLNF